MSAVDSQIYGWENAGPWNGLSASYERNTRSTGTPAGAAHGGAAVEGDGDEVEAASVAGAGKEAVGVDIDSVASSTVAMGDGDGGRYE